MSLWNGFDADEFLEKAERIKQNVIIMSLDFGHGQCSASILTDGKGQKLDLALDSGEHEVIPTAIVYEGNEVKIGGQAGGKKGCILYFKDRPMKFGDKLYGKTKKKLMQDFLQTVMKQMVENNRGTIKKDSKILLLVGCPSEQEEWLSQKFEYANMIEEAVKKEVPNIKVVILPESRAAFYNTMVNDEKDISLDNGILVLDFGSSTTDYTWMQTGKKPLEGSWRLGASEIECLMMDVALANVDEVCDLSDLEEMEMRRRGTWAMRSAKETYYNGMDVGGVNINIYECDEYGRRIRQMGRNGKEIPKIKFHFGTEVDENFMGEVMEETFTLQGKGRGKNHWKGHCRAFVRELVALIIERNLSCETVILTGGASKMDFIEEICKEEFKKIGIPPHCINKAKKPSLSVSRGLVAAAKKDITAAGKQKKLLDNLTPLVDRQMNNFITNVTERVARNCEKATIATIEKWEDDSKTPVGKRSRKALLEKLRKALEVPCGEGETKRIITECYDVSMGLCRKEIQDAVNVELSGIYGNRLDEDSYQLNDIQWKKIKDECNISNLKNSSSVGWLARSGFKEFIEGTVLLGLSVADAVSGKLNEWIDWTGFSFRDNRTEKKLKQINEGDLSQKDRHEIYNKQKEMYYTHIYPKIYLGFKGEMEKIKGQDGNSIERLVVDALEEAFDIIAYYG